MRKLFFIPMLALVFACADTVTEPQMTLEISAAKVARADVGGPWAASITGSGHYVTGPLAYNPGVWRTFTINAKKAMDGSVEGKFKVLLHVEDGPPITYKGPISCFTIVGNTAWVGAHLPGNDPSDIAFHVVDNGEGQDSPPDQAGLFVEAAFWNLSPGLAQMWCDETPEYLTEMPFPYNVVPVQALLRDIEAGNIQIR
jgi:hypothetical protein